jgi:folate-binding protein YgfZ
MNPPIDAAAIKWTKLNERSLISLEGEGVREFLQRLITCDCKALKQDEMAYGALLTPQGKISFDFFVFTTLQGVMIDVAQNERDALLKKLSLYRLRSPIIIEAKEDILVFACDAQDYSILDKEAFGLKAHRVFQDPRHKAMGCRIYGKMLPKITIDTQPYLYHQQRIQLGLSELGQDYESSQVYPHEVLMDQYEGASNIVGHKGCYVGQEVVSRMKHRATVRKRMIKIAAESELPPLGTDIIAGEKKIGQMGSHANHKGLGLIRLDRLNTALQNESPIICGEMNISAELPDWVNFTLNENNEHESEAENE